MSLQVWLPFTSDLTTVQGLHSTTLTSSNVTLDNRGKLGKCAYFSGSSSYIQTNYPTNIGTNDFSISLWLKIPTISSGSYFAICTSKTNAAAGVGFGIYWNYSQKKFLWSTADGSSATEIWMADTVDTIVYDKWIHLVMVRNSSDNKIGYFYINGTRYELASVPAIRNIATATNMWLGRTSNGPYCTKMYINDFRIYDHALSPKEIKLLSQGLVCHYKLDDIYATNNLIVNGYGQDGGTGWTVPANISTTEIPPDHPEIKASFYNGTESPLIPWDSGHTYTISAYLKANGSGTSYPAFRPYDIDKKYIQYFHCSMAFSNSYKTTLAQPLHKGDTVIYAADLSAWTTGDNYYYHVAIFGYKDSTGYVYPDMQYTQDCPLFGTKTDKSHIDKTNNTITLNSAYTGEDRPAGTTICQATEGSTYYYPFGGINTSTIQDWTYKTATITPYLDGRLRFARYIKYIAYLSAYHAGIQLVDNTTNETIVYDSSGYNYHGTPTSLVVSTDTPRNSLSTYFDGTTSHIDITPCYSLQQVIDKLSVSIWFKTNSRNGTMPNLWSLGENSFVRVRLATDTSLWYYMTGISSTYSTKNLVDNAWHHVVFTFDSGIVTMYLDNEQIGRTDHTGSITTLTVGNINWYVGCYSTRYERFLGKLSDFRIYSTALSPEDIKELYNAPVSISNNGAMFTQGEFVEV